MGEWVAFGLAGIERYLRRQAQFDAYLRRRRPTDDLAFGSSPANDQPASGTGPAATGQTASMGRAGIEPATLGLKVPCSTS
jgi:hypothetical protein